MIGYVFTLFLFEDNYVILLAASHDTQYNHDRSSTVDTGIQGWLFGTFI